jgi:hypothetical protein
MDAIKTKASYLLLIYWQYWVCLFRQALYHLHLVLLYF